MPRLHGPSRPSHGERGRRLLRDTLAVTPVIGTVMILLVATIGTGAILMWGLPNMEAEKAGAEFEGVLEQFYSLDAIAENTMHGGSSGKAARGSLNIPAGSIQRADGNWFVVAYYPENTHLGDQYRFTASGYDSIAVAGDPLTIYNKGVTVEDARIVLDTVWNTFHVIRLEYEVEVWAANKEFIVEVGDPAEFNSYPTRLRVMDSASGDTLAAVWFYPMGALEFRRQTSYGPLDIILENAAVLTTRMGGTGLRDKPLLTQEKAGDGSLEFMALFLMLFVDDPTRLGVSAGGAGNYPLYFTLKSNNLRLNGTDVYEVQLDIVGDRAATWMDYFHTQYNFAKDASAPTGVERARICKLATTYADADDAVCPQDPVGDTFQFVLMESLMQISLQLEGEDVSTRPPPPPPGGNDPEPSPPGSGGGVCGGTSVAAAKDCVNSGWDNDCAGEGSGPCKLE